MGLVTSDLNDIGVLGSGPAALAIAASCTRRGASVTLVAPEPEAPWQPNYCLWADEIPPAMEELVEHVWAEASIVTPLGETALVRPYVKLNTHELQDFFWSKLRSGNLRVVRGRATRVEHRRGETCIHTEDGAIERLRVVIDASGARSPFIERTHHRVPAFQTAFGRLVRAPNHGFDPDRMVLMDFRPASNQDTDPPTFLYVLPLSEDRLFIEETSLARRPAMRMDVLRARLENRLVSLGLQHCDRMGEEHCSIAMGLGLPVREQPLVPFGAAGAMVHPASGYLIANVLRKADPVAASIVDGLGSGHAAVAIQSANAKLWPRGERTAWELYSFGLEALVDMDSTEAAHFFDSFFQLPQEGWSGFLGGTLSPSELGRVMTRLFRSLPVSLRWHLLRTALSVGAAPLTRSVLQPGTT